MKAGIYDDVGYMYAHGEIKYRGIITVFVCLFLFLIGNLFSANQARCLIFNIFSARLPNMMTLPAYFSMLPPAL